jgi:hypothetical protein
VVAVSSFQVLGRVLGRGLPQGEVSTALTNYLARGQLVQCLRAAGAEERTGAAGHISAPTIPCRSYPSFKRPCTAKPGS